MFRALYTGYHPPALPDSVHFCGVIGYFCASIIQIVYFAFSRHNAAASVLFSQLVQHTENVHLYFGHFPQKCSLRPDRPVTIKVQCRGALFLTDNSLQNRKNDAFFPLRSIPENIFQKMYRTFSRFFSNHATFSHVRGRFFTYLHHICMLVATA